MREHVQRDVQAAANDRNLAAGKSLLEQISEAGEELIALAKTAKSHRELTVAVNAWQGRLRALELQGRATGELSSGGTTVNIALGVRMDVAQRRVQLVDEARSMDSRGVALKAAEVLRAWNAAHPHDQIGPLRAADAVEVDGT